MNVYVLNESLYTFGWELCGHLAAVENPKLNTGICVQIRQIFSSIMSSLLSMITLWVAKLCWRLAPGCIQVLHWRWRIKMHYFIIEDFFITLHIAFINWIWYLDLKTWSLLVLMNQCGTICNISSELLLKANHELAINIYSDRFLVSHRVHSDDSIIINVLIWNKTQDVVSFFARLSQNKMKSQKSVARSEERWSFRK